MPVDELADALRVDEDEVEAGLRALAAALEGRGIVLRELAGGWTLALAPGRRGGRAAAARAPAHAGAHARRRPRRSRSSPTCSRSRGPEVARIRGVASESAAAALVERGLIEEAGRSQFGAVLYRTTPLFLKLFGLRSVDELPDPSQWDPSPEDQAALRDRLLRAGEERAESPREPRILDARVQHGRGVAVQLRAAAAVASHHDGPPASCSATSSCRSRRSAVERRAVLTPTRLDWRRGD